MESNSLDKFIKDKLVNLDAGNPLDTWAQLNDKLDANLTPTSEEDLVFDSNIKENLEELNAIEMADWDNFLPALELDENLEAIEADLVIDNTVKANLVQLEADYDPNTWTTLSDKLNLADVLEHEKEDLDLDQVAYDKLLNITVPQQAGDWESFEKDLDKEFVLPFKLLFKYKLAEVAILTSLILIFFQLNPIVNNSTQPNLEVVEEITILNTSSDISDGTERIVTKAATAATPLAHTISKPTLNKKATVKRQNNVSDIKAAHSINNSSQSKNFTSLSTSLTITNNRDADRNNNTINDEPILEVSSPVAAVVSAKGEQIEKEKSVLKVISDKDSNVNQGFGPVLNTAKLPTEALVNLNIDDNGVQFCKSCYQLGSVLRWRLGAHLDGKYEYIMTAYDNVFDLESYNHSTFGYGAGLSTSILLGNWELESGFDYASRQYSPRGEETLGSIAKGFLRVQLDKIQMNILSIPLNLRYHFKDKLTKTHFYMHAGATLNVATQANYFIKSEFLNNARRPSVNETSRLFEESETTSDKIYSLGWFEGGSYLENRYLTANIGLGFERKISGRYSIFGQTTYSHFLDNKGLGPNDDRFHTINFSTGVRALFK